MRDDGHMQGGGCHDRRRRDHTGSVATRPMGIGNARHRGPSPSAAKTAVGTSGCCRRLSPRGCFGGGSPMVAMADLDDDDPMSVTGYAIGALAVMLLPVVLVVPSLAAHG